MIRVAFIGAVSKEWMGGLNYFKNLLYALSTIEKRELEVFVFVGKNTDEDIKTMFRQYAVVIEDSIFDRKSIKWFLHKIENKFFKTNFILESVLKKYDIKVLSHSSIVRLNGIKTINWIPDFQHLHLMDMFSQNEIKNRDANFINLIKNSHKIVLSSYDALNDLKVFAPEHIAKADVLQFVSQPDVKYFSLTQKNEEKLREKYNLKDEFFYIPNQFWKHKNHMLVLQAVKMLVDDGIRICVVCTGYLKDYRNKNHIDEIEDFIKINKLEDNMKLLGLVEYEDVFGLIKFSKAVINPSLFEGWSSTVEECKSVAKEMILSDLDVHKEQYPTATFFQRKSAESLKSILKDYESLEHDKEIETLEIRTKLFANRYVEIVKEVVNDNEIQKK
ncbi:MAG: glycosyltransferase [Sulfurimonas sp.]|nr:glycosyltransferase [Sulfurimonas sp.]MDD3834973.1 glycosyltransferase [Sulfurimonas sp.]